MFDRPRILPDETVKTVYRETKRALRRSRSRDKRSELQARLEFLERVFQF